MNIIFVIIATIIALLAVGFAYNYRNQYQRLQQTLTTKEETLVSLRDDIKVRDKQIKDIQKKSEKLSNKVATADTQKASLEEKISEMQSIIDTYEHDSRQSKALFSTLSDIAYDYVFVLDETDTIISYNQSASILFDGKNAIGESLESVLDAPDLMYILHRAIDEEEVLEDQFIFNKRYYRARTQVTHHTDDSYFIGVAIQDITQLVRLNRARRDMVANISHELRTPITKIRLVIDNLFHDVNRPKRKASITSLKEISEEVGELESVVQELLDLSMIESGQAIMKLVDEPLKEIVDAAVERLQEKLDHKEIGIVRNIPEKLHVLCEREHIRRVITNLISNAIKWSPRDDVITITATQSGEDVTVSVFDNGPGVPDDQRERVFERFYQVDTARSGTEGSGLGLAISKHIVEAHGGRIWAEGNSQGNGGRFLFTVQTSTPVDEDAYMDKGQHDFEF